MTNEIKDRNGHNLKEGQIVYERKGTIARIEGEQVVWYEKAGLVISCFGCVETVQYQRLTLQWEPHAHTKKQGPVFIVLMDFLSFWDGTSSRIKHGKCSCGAIIHGEILFQ